MANTILNYNGTVFGLIFQDGSSLEVSFSQLAWNELAPYLVSGVISRPCMACNGVVYLEGGCYSITDGKFTSAERGKDGASLVSILITVSAGGVTEEKIF